MRTVHAPAAANGSVPAGRGSLIGARSGLIGGAAGVMMAGFYGGVVGAASGSWFHLRDQIGQDWPYLVVIIAGFAVQVTLIAELRRRRRLTTQAAVAGGVGTGASTGGMIACCAHHLADLLPFVGVTGAAAFLIDYRVPFMLLGIGANGVGVYLAARRLQRLARGPGRKPGLATKDSNS